LEKDSLNHIKLLVIGGSAGSLEVILQFLPELKAVLPISIVIVLHRKNSSDTTLTMLLSSRTVWKVKEAEEKEMIEPNTIYIVPPDYHLLIEKDYTISLDDSEKVNYSRPSIDVTFESAADIYGPEAAGLLLSGANADGVQGLKAISRKHGIVAIQDPKAAEISFMPQQALEQVHIDYVLPNENIGAFINSLGNTPFN
jgi:two-component system chemotaxis response regulator CheB